MQRGGILTRHCGAAQPRVQCGGGARRAAPHRSTHTTARSAAERAAPRPAPAAEQQPCSTSSSEATSSSSTANGSSTRRGTLLRASLAPLAPLLAPAVIGSSDTTTIVNSVLGAYGLPTLKASAGFRVYDEFSDGEGVSCVRVHMQLDR